MTDILIFKNLASVSQSSQHRVTSDLEAFEVKQSELCTADVGGLRAEGGGRCSLWAYKTGWALRLAPMANEALTVQW
jgi:hypothetical protein